jgi:hypothetical protein
MKRTALGAAVVLAAALALMGAPTMAASSKPALTVSASGGVGGTLTVSGVNFEPSSGGQMVILWIGYPDDYCAPQPADPSEPWACHGFYSDPIVADDGTFSVDFTNACLQAGTGKVSAIQYNVHNDKWLTVDTETYVV